MYKAFNLRLPLSWLVYLDLYFEGLPLRFGASFDVGYNVGLVMSLTLMGLKVTLGAYKDRTPIGLDEFNEDFGDVEELTASLNKTTGLLHNLVDSETKPVKKAGKNKKKAKKRR